jgi:steroid delta-isomerase-like uncharacterized protein
MEEGSTRGTRKPRTGGAKRGQAGQGETAAKAAAEKSPADRTSRPKAATKRPAGGAAAKGAAAKRPAGGAAARGAAAKRSAGAAAPKGPAAARTPRPRRSAKSRANEELARGYYEAIGRRDADAVASHWSDQGVADIVPLTVLRGPEEIKSYFRELFTAVPDLETVVQRIVCDDSRAAVEWRMSGTFTGGPFQGIEPTGRSVEMRGFTLLEVEDGKLVGDTVYYDGMAFARQVGMMPPQDSGAERAMKGALNAVTRLRKTVGERMASR